MKASGADYAIVTTDLGMTWQVVRRADRAVLWTGHAADPSTQARLANFREARSQHAHFATGLPLAVTRRMGNV